MLLPPRLPPVVFVLVLSLPHYRGSPRVLKVTGPVTVIHTTIIVASRDYNKRWIVTSIVHLTVLTRL
jgi:hypothetical protein